MKDLPKLDEDNKEGLWPYVMGEKQLPDEFYPEWVKQLSRLFTVNAYIKSK